MDLLTLDLFKLIFIPSLIIVSNVTQTDILMTRRDKLLCTSFVDFTREKQGKSCHVSSPNEVNLTENISAAFPSNYA